MGIFKDLVKRYRKWESFTVSYDRRASTVTFIALALAVGLVIGCMFQMGFIVVGNGGLHFNSVTSVLPSPWLWVPLLLFVLIAEVAFFMGPRSIKIEDNSIVLYSTNWYRRLPFAQIEKVEPYSADCISADRPLLCSGGFMGYWGRYRSPRFGTYRACYGDRYKCLLVTMLDSRCYAIGCKDTEALLALLKETK